MPLLLGLVFPFPVWQGNQISLIVTKVGCVGVTLTKCRLSPDSEEVSEYSALRCKYGGVASVELSQGASDEMVDMVSSVNRDGEGSRIKSLMERTPSILKSKFLSVLGNSNELLNGISNKVCICIHIWVSVEMYVC